MKTINEILADIMSNTSNNPAERPLQQCISTGFSALDEITDKLDPGSINVIAARPSMGKMPFALNIASHVALTELQPVVIFTMERSPIFVATQLLSQMTGINHFNLRHQELTESERSSLQAGVKRLEDANIYIEDSPELNAPEVYKRVLNIYEQHARLGLIVIDNLQLMQLDEKKLDADYRKIMRSLKAMAIELNVPIIVLSELERKLEFRESKRPRLSDLPATTIWKNSDRVFYIYRDEVYDANSKDQGIAEVIISKNRNGSTGLARLAFDGQTGTFSGITVL